MTPDNYEDNREDENYELPPLHYILIWLLISLAMWVVLFITVSNVFFDY